MSSRQFEEKGHAVEYKRSRPSPPDELKQTILDFIKNVNPSCKFESMLDVACGSGQSTLMWKDDFAKIYATDISPEQINQAPKTHENIQFSVGSGEDIKFADASMDLITVAQAMHWMDVEKFYSEVKRVLKPGGVLAAFGYNYRCMTLDDDRATDIVMNEFENKHLRGEKGYWAPQRAFAEKNYQDFTFPLEQFKRMQLKCEVEWSVEQIAGLLASFSAYQTYMNANPGSTLLQDTRQRLDQIYQGRKAKITIPIFLLLGHN